MTALLLCIIGVGAIVITFAFAVYVLVLDAIEELK